MKNTMIRRLLAGILGTAALAAGAAEPVIDLSAKTEKLVAFQEPGKFCGWPANEGIWSWGDEILVGFELRDYLKSSKTHSADYSKPGRCVLARSLDGGRSWKLERRRRSTALNTSATLPETTGRSALRASSPNRWISGRPVSR